jgi:hypothetical protein
MFAPSVMNDLAADNPMPVVPPIITKVLLLSN